MKKMKAAVLLLFLIAGGVGAGLAGCGKAGYAVRFESEWDRECFSGLKESYAAGEKVKLCYGNEYIGTDTDYSFFVDGEELSADYSERRGFILSFRMPDHDVTVTVGAHSSMIR